MAPFLSKSLGLKRLQGSNLRTRSNKVQSLAQGLFDMWTLKVYSPEWETSQHPTHTVKYTILSRKQTMSCRNYHVMSELSTLPLKVNGDVLRVLTRH